jgi:hypothetical protein
LTLPTRLPFYAPPNTKQTRTAMRYYRTTDQHRTMWVRTIMPQMLSSTCKSR